MKDNNNSTNKYGDIIHLNGPPPNPLRPKMSRLNRAAQFSPFAALTGHENAVRETARLTDKKIELSESALASLNRKFNIIRNNLHLCEEIVFTYFLPDKKKSGGKYINTSGIIKRIDNIEGNIKLTDGRSIPIDDILDLECEFLREYEQ